MKLAVTQATGTSSQVVVLEDEPPEPPSLLEEVLTKTEHSRRRKQDHIQAARLPGSYARKRIRERAARTTQYVVAVEYLPRAVATVVRAPEPKKRRGRQLCVCNENGCTIGPMLGRIVEEDDT